MVRLSSHAHTVGEEPAGPTGRRVTGDLLPNAARFKLTSTSVKFRLASRCSSYLASFVVDFAFLVSRRRSVAATATVTAGGRRRPANRRGRPVAPTSISRPKLICYATNGRRRRRRPRRRPEVEIILIMIIVAPSRPADPPKRAPKRDQSGQRHYWAPIVASWPARRRRRDDI